MGSRNPQPPIRVTFWQFPETTVTQAILQSRHVRAVCSEDTVPGEVLTPPQELGEPGVRASGLILDLGSPCQNTGRIIGKERN